MPEMSGLREACRETPREEDARGALALASSLSAYPFLCPGLFHQLLVRSPYLVLSLLAPVTSHPDPGQTALPGVYKETPMCTLQFAGFLSLLFFLIKLVANKGSTELV